MTPLNTSCYIEKNCLVVTKCFAPLRRTAGVVSSLFPIDRLVLDVHGETGAMSGPKIRLLFCLNPINELAEQK